MDSIMTSVILPGVGPSDLRRRATTLPEFEITILTIRSGGHTIRIQADNATEARGLAEAECRDDRAYLSAEWCTVREAREASRALANGTRGPRFAAMDDKADEVDDTTIEELDQRLRRQHPEAFDNRGRLRKRALARALVTHFGGRHLTREQVDDVIAAGREAAARRRAAG